VFCVVVEQLSDIDWLPSDDSDDDDEPVADNDRLAAAAAAAAAADDDDGDDMLSIDVQDSPVVGAGIVSMTEILPLACPAQIHVCCFMSNFITDFLQLSLMVAIISLSHCCIIETTVVPYVLKACVHI